MVSGEHMKLLSCMTGCLDSYSMFKFQVEECGKKCGNVP